MEEQESMRRLFTSEPYVKSEYQYHRITNKGNIDQEQLHENWTSYLEEYKAGFPDWFLLSICLTKFYTK